MENLTHIIAEIGALIAGGGLAGALFYRERKRAEHLKNETTASEQWRLLFERSDKDNREKDVKIDTLYDEIAKWRDENNKLITENTILSMQKCVVNGCANRKPPRAY